ncbi:hypothetical protein GCM10009623_04490 [Nocardioides aestuarii]|uniref:Lipoprotein n=1 Tax=Nocardioides aestuarii TaxID=252231 RepID=A0ABW4TJL8_9ACTN
MPASPPLRTSRRRVLTASAVLAPVVLGTAGCDVVAPVPEPSGEDRSTPTATPSDTTGAGADADADEQLVERVADDVARTLALVESAGRGRPSVRRSLRGVARTHRAHLDELVDSRPTTRRVRVGGDDAAALRRTRTAEQRLQRRLAEAAVDARSGPLGALLASMAAAIAQQLATGALA